MPYAEAQDIREMLIGDAKKVESSPSWGITVRTPTPLTYNHQQLPVIPSPNTFAIRHKILATSIEADIPDCYLATELNIDDHEVALHRKQVLEAYQTDHLPTAYARAISIGNLVAPILEKNAPHHSVMSIQAHGQPVEWQAAPNRSKTSVLKGLAQEANGLTGTNIHDTSGTSNDTTKTRRQRARQLLPSKNIASCIFAATALGLIESSAPRQEYVTDTLSREILRLGLLAMLGMTNEEIGREEHVTVNTIKSLEKLYPEAGGTRKGLAQMFLRRGYATISPPSPRMYLTELEPPIYNPSANHTPRKASSVRSVQEHRCPEGYQPLVSWHAAMWA